MDIFQALILGLVQGPTEFIPVSSSAHLIIVPWLFGWPDPGLAFDVALHLGTLAALLIFFAGDWARLFRAGMASIAERKIGADADRRLAWLIVIGCIPGAVVGALAEGKIVKLFHRPNAGHNAGAMIAMGVIIALLGAALFVAERIAKHARGMESLSLKDSVVIGISQALAIFPGVSRSGATITAGLFLNLTRATAARYSFLLSAPIIAGAGAKSIFGLIRGGVPSSEWIFFGVGFLAALLSGYAGIKYLLRFLQRNSTDVFVYYRWLLAALVIVFALTRR
jgi:undecaprenyl-diphosphatase